MRYILAILFMLASVTLVSAQYGDYAISAVPFTKVKLTDKFWLPRIKTNHEVTIPASFERCESTGRIKNFEMAATRSGKFCTVFPFDDTDIYKTIEGASYSLSLNPDLELETYIDSLITKIGNAQEPDGYLYTARTIDPLNVHAWVGKERWEKERNLSHELYNAGHLYEAAVAHYEATGKMNLLNIALKNADLVCSVFGPGKRHVAPGHEVVEIGLIKLYRLTGKKAYLETAKDFIEERGRYNGYDSTSIDPFKNGAYWQDHKPVVEQDEAIGHAVRAGYLYAAVADVAALTRDSLLLDAIDKIWSNMVGKKFYVQGGIGASGEGERFAGNYELPNATAYNETCAAIANVYWNHRMFLLHGESKYIDILERSLYNGLISGVGLDGKSFFYTNAMEIKNHSSHKSMEAGRSGWFTCSCCPTNITRLVPSVPGYMYAMKGDVVYVNLFAQSTASVFVGDNEIQISQENNYPWDGNLVFKISPGASRNFKLMIRIPAWARNEIVPSDLYTSKTKIHTVIDILVNGEKIPYVVEKGYALLSRIWTQGDLVEVRLPMDVQQIVSHEKVENNLGKVALQRGPLVYCAEWLDNAGMVSNLILPQESNFKAEFNKALLNGVTVIKSEAIAVNVDSVNVKITSKKQPFVAIPYYAWAHRGKGEMAVWIPQRVTSVELISK